MSQTSEIPVALFIGVKQTHKKRILREMKIFQKRIPIKNLDIYISDKIYAVKAKSLILDQTNLEYHYKELLIALELGLKSINRIFFVIKLEKNNMCDKIQPFLRQFKGSCRYLTVLINCQGCNIEYDIQEIKFHFQQLGIDSVLFFNENQDLSQEILNVTLLEKQQIFSLYNYIIKNLKEIDEQNIQRPNNQNTNNQKSIQNGSYVNQRQQIQKNQDQIEQQYQVYYPQNSREVQLLGSQNQRIFSNQDKNYHYQNSIQFQSHAAQNNFNHAIYNNNVQTYDYYHKSNIYDNQNFPRLQYNP